MSLAETSVTFEELVVCVVFLPALQYLLFVDLFVNDHYDLCKVIPYYNFDLDFYDAEHLLMCLLLT